MTNYVLFTREMGDASQLKEIFLALSDALMQQIGTFLVDMSNRKQAKKLVLFESHIYSDHESICHSAETICRFCKIGDVSQLKELFLE